jgi:type II secretory pathway component PulF
MSETILSFLLGIGLSAAVGFRIFVPMLVVSLASMAGVIQLAPGFQWMGTPVAALVFAVATLIELLGFLIPWVSNALDSIATPAATIAGVIMMAAVLTDMHPVARWALAIIAGGGVALTVQGATVTRAVAAGSTGGAASPIVALFEAIGALVVTVTTIVIPLIMGVLVLVVVLLLLRIVIPKFRAIRAGRRAEGKT